MNTYQKVIESGKFTRLSKEEILAVTWWIELGIKKKNETFEELLDAAKMFYAKDISDFMLPNLLEHIRSHKELERDFKAMCILYDTF